MTIVGISICSRLGNPIISRNFSKLSHSRLENLLSQFTQSFSSTQQHSYVQTDEALFLFQPLSQLYLVLIASKGSNVFQYVDCLHLVGRYISSLCDSLEDQEIVSKSSEIILALDEIVICGNFDLITLPQINSNLVMQSQEEELQELVEKNKIQEARQVGKLKMKQLELERRDGGGSLRKATSSEIGGNKSRDEITTEKIDLMTPSSSASKGKSIRSGKGLNLKKY